jgi:thiosulfate/3-mercaptopyruvate sulfurtransferase
MNRRIRVSFAYRRSTPCRPPNKWLVETSWLAEHLDAPDVVVLDGSMHLPTAKRDANAEYLAEHIPGAQFFSIDEIADEASTLPHMLPSPAKFASRMKKMGIGDGMRVIAYDSEGLYSAARVWWMFRTMGHDDVAVLNGGLKKWKAEGRPLDSGPPAPRAERHFTARFHADLVRDASDVKGLIGSKNTQIIDARAAARFEGTVAEPRQGLRSGHIPGPATCPSPPC